MKSALKEQIQRWGPVFRLAWPLIVANSFWNLQMTIDRMFLGEYSTVALGASVAVMSLFWTPMALLQQTAAYVTTFVAQYKGSKKIEMIGPSFWNSIYISIIGGLLFLLFIPVSEWLFTQLGHSEKMVALEAKYFAAVCFSALPTAIVAAVSGLFTGVGQTRIIMGINAVGMVFNVIFDYLLIFGNLGFPAMGIEGAGYATALANFCGAAFGLVYLFTRKSRKEWNLLKGWRLNRDLFGRYLRFGVPSGLQWSLEGLAFAVFLAMLGQMPNGDAALASSSIAVTLLLLAALPCIGIGQAISALVGDYIGQKEPEKAVRDTWAGFQIATLYIFTVGLTFIFFPSFYLNWFYNDSDPTLWAEVVRISPAIFVLVAIFMLFDAINFVIGFALKGAGDTRFVFLVALIVPWPLMVLPTYLVRDMSDGAFWGWVGVTVWVIVQDSIYLFRFLGGKWKTMSVTGD